MEWESTAMDDENGSSYFLLSPESFYTLSVTYYI